MEDMDDLLMHGDIMMDDGYTWKQAMDMLNTENRARYEKKEGDSDKKDKEEPDGKKEEDPKKEEENPDGNVEENSDARDEGDERE